MQSDNSLPSFEELEAIFEHSGAVSDPSEAHGMLCGMICASGKADLAAWHDHVLGEAEAESGDGGREEAESALANLHEVTVNQLGDEEFGFSLLLHSDDETCDVRVEDLANWCRGFVIGLASGGITDLTKLPEEAAEVIRDMLEIARAGYETGSDENENEIAITEIIEYVRVGALVVLEEVAATLSPQIIKPTLH